MTRSIPSVSVTYARNGASTTSNELGMRAMQERAYERRGEQYLLIKSPPASGKSRALMFIALDKLHNQGLKQVIVVVPEKSIGSSFNNEPLSNYGFEYDWTVQPQWNLCDVPGGDDGKVGAVGRFLASEDRILICTHATFRFAVDRFGIEVFDDRLIAVDEFHHVSANPDNKLGAHLGQLIARDRVHVVAMTGSYFRGDAEAVLSPEDESKFDTVTYTYYEQLNGYEHLKTLDIGYFFYTGSYADDILAVLKPSEKTILHIPNVNARESTGDKHKEVDHIIDALGKWQETDPVTGFHLVKTPEGQVIKIADLVDDDPTKRERVSKALKDPAQKNNRDHVDLIIALGMAKEGFDWIWCEHALTVGYRASLTEIVQIIGRATRDAKGKTRSRFTNLIAEPDASEGAVTEAINDTLKAIAASLLMEQVLAPRFNFTPKAISTSPEPGFDYGEGGYDPAKTNIGFNEQTGQFQIEIKGLAQPKSKEAERICQEDLNEVITAFVQDKPTLERGLFDGEQAGGELVAEELTVVRMSSPSTNTAPLRSSQLAKASVVLSWRNRTARRPRFECPSSLPRWHPPNRQATRSRKCRREQCSHWHQRRRNVDQAEWRCGMSQQENASETELGLTKAAASLILAAEALEKASTARGGATRPAAPRRGLSRGEAADYIGVSQTLFDTLVKAGQMPKPLKAMSRVIWDIRALDEAFTDLATEQTENPWN